MPRPSSLLTGMFLGGAIALGGLTLGAAGRATGYATGHAIGPALEQDDPRARGAAAAPDVSDLLRTRQLEIVDEAGTVRLVVGTNTHGGTISVRDRLGRTVMLVGAADHGGMIVATNSDTWQPAMMAGAVASGGAVQLFDRQGRRSLDVVASTAGGELTLASTNGRPTGDGRLPAALRLRAGAAGTGMIDSLGPDGRPRFRMFTDSAGGGVIETYQPTSSRALVSLSSTVGGHGQVKTTAPSGQPLVMLTATANDEGQLYTYSGTGQPLVAIASRDTGPSLRVFNRNGNAAVTLESNTDGNGTVGVWKPDGSGRVVEPE